ncbi:GTPase Obg [Novipirellula galeiformis]|uniref:GTPase Obg n=2 Tax=Novipirellula galeiformis TaxID=2528004 RepID=A0A5C6CMW5_9BACT|nr:GTPase Obg [Novipirellula galeiformis]
MSFRREKFVPRGGPDGGDGGEGASLILEARDGVNSLAAFANRRMYRATKGQPGQGSMRNGRRGRDQRLFVPPGTTVIDADNGFVIKDLAEPGDQFVVARGGKGGRGNASFKSSTNRAPRDKTMGEMGESRDVILELKSIADVGLVGMPNAGKSTLLSRITSARPEIADYPFTTKHPNLGIVEIGIERSFVLADIPGLIEGASEGIGLGHEFLRHVERAGLLVHLVEPAPTDGTDPLHNYHAIRSELTQYDASLGDREEILVVSKSEMEGAEELRQALADATGKQVRMISALNGEGLDELKNEIMERVQKRRNALLVAKANKNAPVAEVVSEVVSDSDEAPKPPRRLPPHLSGATAMLSDANPPRDFDLETSLEKSKSKSEDAT